MKCIKCNKKADYIINGNSLCTDCKSSKKNEEIEPRSILLTNEQQNKLLNNYKFVWGQKPKKIVQFAPTLFDGYIAKAIYPEPIFLIGANSPNNLPDES